MWKGRILAQKTTASTEINRLGDNVRTRRRELGLTLQDVADGAGLSVGFISQLERSLTSPSLTSLAAISRILDVDFTALFAPPKGDSQTTRAGKRQHYALDGSSFNYERISSNFPGHILNAVILTELPGSRREVSRHEGEEIYYILSGALTVEIEGNVSVLGIGDSIHFQSSRSHSTWNHTSDVTKILVVVTTDIFGDGPVPDDAD